MPRHQLRPAGAFNPDRGKTTLPCLACSLPLRIHLDEAGAYSNRANDPNVHLRGLDAIASSRTDSEAPEQRCLRIHDAGRMHPDQLIRIQILQTRQIKRDSGRATSLVASSDGGSSDHGPRLSSRYLKAVRGFAGRVKPLPMTPAFRPSTVDSQILRKYIVSSPRQKMVTP